MKQSIYKNREAEIHWPFRARSSWGAACSVWITESRERNRDEKERAAKWQKFRLKTIIRTSYSKDFSKPREINHSVFRFSTCFHQIAASSSSILGFLRRKSVQTRHLENLEKRRRVKYLGFHFKGFYLLWFTEVPQKVIELRNDPSNISNSHLS